MELAERKARILQGQHLTAPEDQAAVCRDLNGIQAQFMSAALHNLSIRTGGEAAPEQLVKSWTIRGTVHLFGAEDLPLFLHQERSRYLREVDQMTADQFITLGRKRFFAGCILDCLARGICGREELKEACFARGMTRRESESVFNGWGGTLRALAEQGLITHKVREDKAFQLCPPFAPMEREAALLEQTRRYFTHYGPATVRDAAYYFGRPQREIKARMALLPLEHAVVDGRDCFWLERGQADSPEIPRCLFLGNFDQLMLGYEKKESIFLPEEYLREIFNLAGIVMAPILLWGRVAGRWKQRNGVLTIMPFGSWTRRDEKAALNGAEALWELKRIVWER